jgi:DNA polymerase/3'-5' exonuclease PolX
MGIFKFKNTIGRIDVRFVDKESWPFALLYFTGPKSFNIKMRNQAKEEGYEKLNEYGLYLLDGRPVEGIKNEEDIFDFLGMDYVDPDERY